MTGSIPQIASFAIHGPLQRADLPPLYERFCDFLVATGPSAVLCDVRGCEPNVVAVDALARMQLAARRNRCEVRLCNASDRLLALVAFLGLTDVLPAGDQATRRPGAAGARTAGRPRPCRGRT